MTHTPLLAHKHAVIVGAGGAIGTALANEFATHGATVCLVGRGLASLERLAAAIVHAGGSAQAAEVDALDEPAVDASSGGVID